MLLLTVTAVVLVTGLLLRVVARGLGTRMPWRVVVIGTLLSVVVCAPWLLRPQLLTATDFLTSSLIPAVPTAADAERYQLLNDNALQFLPWEMELRRLWRGGQLGFWSDSLGGGSSPWVNPQAAVLSPIAWLARLFPVEHFFLVRMALKFLVCFLGVALLIRRLGGSWTAGVFGGLATGLSGALMSRALFTHSDTVAWIPWTTAGLLVLARKPSPRSVATSACLIAALLVSGQPEIAFAGGCFSLLVAAWFRWKRGRLRIQVGAVLLAALLGLLLAAPSVLPFVEAMSNSQRAHEVDHYLEILAQRDLTLDPRSWFIEEGRRLPPALLHPYAAGVPFQSTFDGFLNWVEAGSAYAGIWSIAGLALALGLWLRRAFPMIVFASIAVLLSAEFIPLLWVARSLPVVSSMAFARSLMVSSLALCVVAALAFDAVRRRAPSLVAWLLVLMVMVASFAVGGWQQWFLAMGAWIAVLLALRWGEPHEVRDSSRTVNPGTAGVGEAGLRWRGALAAAILLAQLPWAWQMLPRSSPQTFYPPSPVFDALAAASEDGDSVSPHRVLGFGFAGYPSLLSAYGFHQTRSHDPMAPYGWIRVNRGAFGFAPDEFNYFAAVQRVDSAWLDTLAIGAVLFEAPNPAADLSDPALGLEVAWRGGPYVVYRNPDALSRWFVATSWENVDEERLDDALPKLQVAGHILLTEAPTTTAAETIWRSGRSTRGISVQTVKARPGDLTLVVDRSTRHDGAATTAVDAESEGFLLATSLAGPSGWTVRAENAEGEQLQVEKTEIFGAFLGAWVPPDTVRLHLRFIPPLLPLGLLAMGLGLLAVVGLLLRPGALARP